MPTSPGTKAGKEEHISFTFTLHMSDIPDTCVSVQPHWADKNLCSDRQLGYLIKEKSREKGDAVLQTGQRATAGK